MFWGMLAALADRGAHTFKPFSKWEIREAFLSSRAWRATAGWPKAGQKKVRAQHALRHVAPSKSSRKVSGFSSPDPICVELEAPPFNPATQQPCGVPRLPN